MVEEEIFPCSEKISFDSKKAAQTAVTVAEFQHGTRLKLYRCQHCNLWHLASDLNHF